MVCVVVCTENGFIGEMCQFAVRCIVMNYIFDRTNILSERCERSHSIVLGAKSIKGEASL